MEKCLLPGNSGSQQIICPNCGNSIQQNGRVQNAFLVCDCCLQQIQWTN